MAVANETPTYVLCTRRLGGVPLCPLVVPGPSIDPGQSLVGFAIKDRILRNGSLKGGNRLTDGTSTRVLRLVVAPRYSSITPESCPILWQGLRLVQAAPCVPRSSSPSKFVSA